MSAALFAAELTDLAASRSAMRNPRTASEKLDIAVLRRLARDLRTMNREHTAMRRLIKRLARDAKWAVCSPLHAYDIEELAARLEKNKRKSK